MPVITQREQVLAIYRQAAEKGWVIPCLCTENQTTTEAILSAAQDYAEEHKLSFVPITLAMTVRYEHRSQAANYTHTRDWKTGLELFTSDAYILIKQFPNVQLLLHLDHIQHDLDTELLEGDLSKYSSIMYDASALPLEENIKKTSAFVQKRGKEIVIEGACDEIVDAGGAAQNSITDAAVCERYMKETGVDMVVANLGTEHRASGKELVYHGDAARLIKDRIGARIVLHGTSSVPNDQVKALYSDGVCKVNIWTALERDSSPELLEFMVQNACEIAGEAEVDKLIGEGLLTAKCGTGKKPALAFFTTAARQNVVYGAMKRMVRTYIDMWYK